MTGLGVAVLVTATSAPAVTTLTISMRLLAGVGSPMSGEFTNTSLPRLPVVARNGRTTTVTVATAPPASVPRLHDSATVGPGVTPEGVHVPCDGTADWNPPVVTRLASESVTVTLVAASTELLRTVMTYVRSCPEFTGLGLAVFDTTWRSACPLVADRLTAPQSLPGVPSVSALPVSATHALLTSVPAAVARTGTVMPGAFVLPASGPARVQVSVTGPATGNPEFGMHVHPVPLGAAVSSIPAGSVSVTVIVLPAGTVTPLLRTVSV